MASTVFAQPLLSIIDLRQIVLSTRSPLSKSGILENLGPPPYRLTIFVSCWGLFLAAEGS